MAINYFKMKNEDLKKALDGFDVPYPVFSNGKFDRREAARLCMSKDSEEDRKARLESDKCLCVIHGDGSEAGQQAVYVSVVGLDCVNYNANIPRETEVTLPGYVYDFLDGLYYIDYIPMEDQDTGKIKVERRRTKRFKMSMIERFDVSEDED